MTKSNGISHLCCLWSIPSAPISDHLLSLGHSISWICYDIGLTACNREPKSQWLKTQSRSIFLCHMVIQADLGLPALPLQGLRFLLSCCSSIFRCWSHLHGPGWLTILPAFQEQRSERREMRAHIPSFKAEPRSFPPNLNLHPMGQD